MRETRPDPGSPHNMKEVCYGNQELYIQISVY